MAEPYTTIRFGGDGQFLGVLKRLPEFYDQASFFFDWIFLSLIFGFILGEGFKKAHLPKKAGAVVGTVMGFGLAYSLAKKGSSIGEYSPIFAFFATVLFVIVCYSFLRHNFFRRSPVLAAFISIILGIFALSGLYSIVNLGDPLNSVIDGIFTILFIVLGLAFLIFVIAMAVPATRHGMMNQFWPPAPHQQLQQAGQGAQQAGQGAQQAGQGGQQAGQGAQQAVNMIGQIQQGLGPLQGALGQLAQAIAALAARGFPAGAGGGGGGGGGVGQGAPGPIGPGGGGVPPGAGGGGGGGGGGWPGPRGPAGPRGVPGRPSRLPPSPLAPPGASGATGPQGMPGTPGAPGQQGPLGPAGTQGTGGGGPVNVNVTLNPVFNVRGGKATAKAYAGKSKKGRIGQPGAPGQQGPLGPAGTQGPPGQQGAQGEQGPIGATGPAGATPAETRAIQRLTENTRRDIERVITRSEGFLEVLKTVGETQANLPERIDTTKRQIVVVERKLKEGGRGVLEITVLPTDRAGLVDKESTRALIDSAETDAQQVRGLLTTAGDTIKHPLVLVTSIEKQISYVVEDLKSAFKTLNEALADYTQNQTQENNSKLSASAAHVNQVLGTLSHLLVDAQGELKENVGKILDTFNTLMSQINVKISSVKKKAQKAAEETEELERKAKLAEELKKVGDWCKEIRKKKNRLFDELEALYFSFPNNPALKDLRKIIAEKRTTAPWMVLKILFKPKKDEADGKINALITSLSNEKDQTEIQIKAKELKDMLPELENILKRLIKVLTDTKNTYQLNIEKENLELLRTADITNIAGLIKTDKNFQNQWTLCLEQKKNAEEAIEVLESVVKAKTTG